VKFSGLKRPPHTRNAGIVKGANRVGNAVPDDGDGQKTTKNPEDKGAKQAAVNGRPESG